MPTEATNRLVSASRFQSRYLPCPKNNFCQNWPMNQTREEAKSPSASAKLQFTPVILVGLQFRDKCHARLDALHLLIKQSRPFDQLLSDRSISRGDPLAISTCSDLHETHLRGISSASSIQSTPQINHIPNIRGDIGPKPADGDLATVGKLSSRRSFFK